MTMNEIVGTYYVLARTYRQAQASLTVKDKIGDIVAHQCTVRGADKPFTFKALGFKWRYEPDPTVQPLPEISLDAL